MWAQSSFLEDFLEINLPALGVSDLVLDHVYNGFLGGITDGERVGGGIIKTELLAHDWKLCHVTS